MPSLSIEPMTGALGAEVRGVHLGRLSDAEFEAIHQALLDHLVLVFPEQDITPTQHAAFAHRFGQVHHHPFVKQLADHPDVLRIHTRPGDEANFGGGWHADATYEALPLKLTTLHAIKTPPAGGDTLFANGYLGYETLSDGMRRLLDGLTAIHTAEHSYGHGGRARETQQGQEYQNPEAAAVDVAHPAVRVHEETGRRVLYVNEGFTVRFADMTEDESAGLLRYLFRHATQEPFTCRVRWRPGTFTMWDNRCTQHRALYDYRGQERLMHRVAIAADAAA